LLGLLFKNQPKTSWISVKQISFLAKKRNGMGRSVSDLMTLFSRFSGHSSLGSLLSSQKTICIAEFIYIQNSILNARTLSLCSSQATGNFDLLYVLYLFRNQNNTLIPNQTKKMFQNTFLSAPRNT